MADSDIVTPVTSNTSGKPASGLLSLPARSTAQINMSHVHRDTAWKGREGKGREGKGREREGKGREGKLFRIQKRLF